MHTFKAFLTLTLGLLLTNLASANNRQFPDFILMTDDSVIVIRLSISENQIHWRSMGDAHPAQETLPILRMAELQNDQKLAFSMFAGDAIMGGLSLVVQDMDFEEHQFLIGVDRFGHNHLAQQVTSEEYEAAIHSEDHPGYRYEDDFENQSDIRLISLGHSVSTSNCGDYLVSGPPPSTSRPN